VRRGERGFTLVELLVTLTVTTIGLIGLLGLHASISRGNDGADRSAEATTFAHGTLEQLRAEKIQDMVVQLTGNLGSLPPIDVTMAAMTGRNGKQFRRHVVVTQLPASSSLWRIRMEVSWTDDGVVPGSNGGANDHMIVVESVRTVEDTL
jgi:prepilin-type N-terminal cleavage/methylation domain-containing protein